MDLQNESDEEILYDYDPETPLNSDDIFFYPTNLFTNNIISALQSKNFKRAKELILAGKELNLTDDRGYTSLHVAAELGNFSVLKLLLSQESLNKNAVSYMNETALFVSLKKKCNDNIVKKLINSGCDVTEPNLEMVTPLHLAVQRRNINVANLLIVNGADVDAKDSDGYTPLHTAVEATNLEAACMLLYYNASANEKTLFSKATPFMFSLATKNADTIAEILLNYVDDFNDRDGQDYCILELALRWNSPLCEEIIQRGADINQSVHIKWCCQSIVKSCDSKVFKYVWKRLKRKYLLNYYKPFLFTYLESCNFPNSEYIECLNKILTTKYGLEFMVLPKYEENCTLGYYITTRNYSREMRCSILYLCLSMGLCLRFNDVFMIYEKFGFHDELEAILFTNPQMDTSIINFSAMGKCICFNAIDDKRSSYNPKQLCKYLNESPKYWQFFTNFSHTFNNLGTCGFDHTKFTAPSGRVVPSLVELSRDTVRRDLYSKSHYIFEPYNNIRSLCVPQLIKDILYLKQPIYI